MNTKLRFDFADGPHKEAAEAIRVRTNSTVVGVLVLNADGDGDMSFSGTFTMRGMAGFLEQIAAMLREEEATRSSGAVADKGRS